MSETAKSRSPERIASLRSSIEEDFLKDFRAETPADIYFELANILSSRFDISVSDGNGIADVDSLNFARDEARATLKYRIGYRAVAADFRSGTTTELEKLMTLVKGK